MAIEIPGHNLPEPGEVSLDEIRALLGDCHRCPLCETRQHIVFGDGNPNARVVIVGEAPGRNEDKQGIPFVGAAGKNLAGLLSFAGLEREDVYIANILKCRPPSNRNPRVEEIQECSGFLREQIRSIWPDVIVTLGNFATRFILRTDQGISDLRGNVYKAGHFMVFPMYHPAAALYRRAWQPILESDFENLGRWLAEHPATKEQ